MNVVSEKRMELSQTIHSLSDSIRMEQGCRRCDFCQSLDDEDRLFLLEEWDEPESFKRHLKSENYRVLRGAMTLLKQPCSIMFYSVVQPWEKEVV
jgi:quinol monooxygenase YgiN